MSFSNSEPSTEASTDSLAVTRQPEEQTQAQIDDMAQSAAAAAAFLKTLAHEGRLMILCHLSGGEKSVGELESLLNMRQAAVSQMLARLRDEGLVQTRRSGKTIFYSLKNRNTEEVIALLHRQFCSAI